MLLKVGDVFNSYAELRARLKKFEESTKVFYYKRVSVTIDSVQNVNSLAAGCRPELKYFKIIFACSKGVKVFRGEGNRIIKRKPKLNACPARIKVTVSGDGQVLRINEIKGWHNHPVQIDMEERSSGDVSLVPVALSMNNHHQDSDRVERGNRMEAGMSRPVSKEPPTTTLSMLNEKVQCKDLEFIESCQQTQILPSQKYCTCDCSMKLQVCSSVIDGVYWKCRQCPNTSTIKDGTWFSEFQNIKLKDCILILFMYIWEFPVQYPSHELGIDQSSVFELYLKCNQLCSQFFHHEICCIGGRDKTILINTFLCSTGDLFVGGVEEDNLKLYFFQKVDTKFSRDDLITAIIDNTKPKSTIKFLNSDILSLVGEEGCDYLSTEWKVYVDQEDHSSLDKSTFCQIWNEFAFNLKSMSFTKCKVFEYLFRQRICLSKDRFLSFLLIISTLHPPTHFYGQLNGKM